MKRVARPDAAVRLWSGRELRRRWPSLVVLGLMAGLAAGVVTAALSGAQRAGTAYERMRREQLAADAVFFPSQVEFYDADVTKLATIPEVAAWSGFALMPGRFDELEPEVGPFVPVGDGWFRTIERAKVLAGRLPDPARDDELVINEAAAQAGGRVGRTLTLRTYARSPITESTSEGSTPEGTSTEPPDGPVVRMNVVGVVRMPMDSVLAFAGGEPEIYPSPGFFSQHRDEMAIDFTNAFVRLRHGAADLPAFQRHIAEVYGRSDIPIKDLSDDVKRVENSTQLERTALLLFAAAALVASIVLVGQAFVRSSDAGADAVPALHAMGLGSRALTVGLVLPTGLSAATAAAVTVATTYLLSARFPIGLARRVDPSLGYHFQPSYVALGALAAVVACVAMAVVASMLTIRAALCRTRPRRTRVVGALTRTGAPLPAAVGASLALEPAGGRRPVPVRPALVAATAAILGIVGAITLVGGIDDAVHEPSRSGRSWALEGYPDTLEQIRRAADVGGLADLTLVSRFAGTVRQKDDPFYALQSFKGSIQFVALHGRLPRGDDEAMVGARTAKGLGLRLGDTFRDDSGAGPTLRVVGIGLLIQTPHSTFDEGTLVSMRTLDAVSRTTVEHREGYVVANPAKGTEVSTLQARLRQATLLTAPPAPVRDVANLANVRRLPYLLAGFLVVLGLGAVGHALLTVSRRRARELAVLRAVGLSPGQAAACVTWQAMVVAGIALVIGVPIGLLLGRELWRRVAASVPLVYVGPFSPALVLVVVPAVLAALLCLALAPAWRAAHLRTAATLRTE